MAPKPSQNSGPGTVTPDEREALISLLAESRDALLEATSGVSDHVAITRPEPAKWSIVDCVEHLAVSDEAILALVTDQILSGPADPGYLAATQGKAELVIKAMRDRSEKRRAFSYLEPAGRWTTLQEALAAFEQRREHSIDYVRSTNAELHFHAAPLGALGDLTAYQWLLMMAVHTERHIAQIQELAQAATGTKA